MFLTLKTVILMGLSSLKKIEDLQALSISPTCMDFASGLKSCCDQGQDMFLRLLPELFTPRKWSWRIFPLLTQGLGVMCGLLSNVHPSGVDQINCLCVLAVKTKELLSPNSVTQAIPLLSSNSFLCL